MRELATTHSQAEIAFSKMPLLMRLASAISPAAGFPRRAARPRSTSKFGAPAPAKRAHVVVSFAEKKERIDDGDDDESKSGKKPADDEDDDDAPPSLPAGAWRNFRASLVASAAAAAGEKPGPSGDVWSARWTPENVHLFQEQDRELARLAFFPFRFFVFSAAARRSFLMLLIPIPRAGKLLSLSSDAI